MSISRATIEFASFLKVNVNFGPAGGSVVLTDGAASAFSEPLRRNVRYNFHEECITFTAGISSSTASVIAARLDLQGDFVVSPAGLWDGQIEELHQLLDCVRHVARERQAACSSSVSSELDDDELTGGPVVLVLGAAKTGKTSVCRSLLNLATTQKSGVASVPQSIKRDRTTSASDDSSAAVTFVDTQLQGGLLAPPACMTTTFLVDRGCPMDDALMSTAAPLMFFVGDCELSSTSRKSFLDFVVHTKQSIRSVHAQRPALASGGVVIDTVGWNDVDDEDHIVGAVIAKEGVSTERGPSLLYKDIIRQMITLFGVTDVVICGGADTHLIQLMGEQNAAIVGRVPLRVHVLRKSNVNDLVVTAGSRRRQKRVDLNLERYFYGTLRTPLSPFRVVVYLEDVVLLDAESFTPMKPSAIQPLMIAAVSAATTADLCSSANVTGFVLVTDVGETTLSLLAPAAGRLPRPYLLFGSLTASGSVVPSMAE